MKRRRSRIEKLLDARYEEICYFNSVLHEQGQNSAEQCKEESMAAVVLLGVSLLGKLKTLVLLLLIVEAASLILQLLRG